MPVLSSLVSVTSPRGEAAHLEAVLSRLYAEQAARAPGSAYLVEHARPRAVASHVAAFHWYRRFLPPTGALLDWGCNHAPDSCLVRAWAGDRYELHGCDFGEPGRFAAFHEFAGLRHERLTHLYQLPYADARYDAVIASGVLEHAAMDYESLKELHRVLKPGGTLVITYLPNRWSWEEWRRRVIYKRDYHRRLYGLTEARRLLAHTGFEVLDGRYQRFGLIGAVICSVLPLHWFGGMLCFATRKVTCM